MKKRSALIAYIEQIRRQPFDEATHNCGLFAGDAYFHFTGIDLIAKYRNSGAQTLTQYIRQLRADGYQDHIDFLAKHFEKVHPSRASVGDFAVFTNDEPIPVIGVVVGAQTAVLGTHCLAFTDTLNASEVYKV